MWRFIRFIRWSRDAGWKDTWQVLFYPVKTWRCRLFGHKWGPEQHDYDWNTHVRTESWRDCERKHCDGYWETYHYAAKGEQRVWG